MIQYKNTTIFLTEEGRLFNKALKQFIPNSAQIIWYDPITGDNLERADVDSWIEQNAKQVETHETPHALSYQPKHTPLSGKSKEEKIAALKELINPPTKQFPTKETTPPHEQANIPHQISETPHQPKRTGNKNSKFKGYFIVSNIKYESARQAALATGLDHKTITNRCYNNLKGCSFMPK